MATVEELDFELNFKWDKKTFSKFNEALKKSVAGFAKLGGAIAAAQGIAFGIAKSVADQNDQLAKLAPRLNTTTEEYQRLKFAAEDFGASGEDVTASLKSLTKAQEDVMRGKGDIEAFGRLGINPADFQNSADLLLAVGDSIQGIQSNSEKINLLERIGVSTNLLQALESGSANIKALGNEFDSLGATVTAEQKKVAGDFQAIWLRATTVVGGVTNKVGSNLLKSINKFLSTFVKFAQTNMKQIIEGFEKFFSVVNKASQFLFSVLIRIFTLVSRIINLMGGLENAVMVAAGAFAILKRRMLLAFAIPLAIAGALFLVIEDIVSAFEGKDSVFGDFLGALGLNVEMLANGFNALKTGIGFVIDSLGTLFNTIGDKFSSFMAFIEEMVASLSGLAETIQDSFSLPSFDDINLPSFGDIGSSVGGLFGSSPQAQAITNNNGGAKNANITINVSGESGTVVDEINRFFQQSSNRLFGE